MAAAQQQLVEHYLLRAFVGDYGYPVHERARIMKVDCHELLLMSDTRLASETLFLGVKSHRFVMQRVETNGPPRRSRSTTAHAY